MNPDKPAQGTKVPDLYLLLGLAPQEPDEQVIKNALRQFADQIKQEKPPAKAKAAAKMFAIAKHNLLEPSRKAAYDLLWSKFYGSQPLLHVDSSTVTANDQIEAQRQVAANSIAEPAWDMSELQPILPVGDVSAPLDLAVFLESQNSSDDFRSLEDLDRDFQRLVQLLGGEVAATSTDGRSESAQFHANPQSSIFPMSATTVENKQTASPDIPFVATAVPVQVVDSRHSTAKSSRKRRKNRDIPLLLMIGGGTTALLVVLGVLVYMLNRKPNQDEMRPVATVDPSRRNKEPVPISSAPKSSGLPTVGSGLPQPGDNSDMPQESSESNDSSKMDDPVMEPTNAPMNEKNPPPAAPSVDNSMALAGSNKPAAPNSAPETMSPTVTNPAPENSLPPASLSDKEKSDWKKLLRSTRQSLTKGDFTAAQDGLNEAGALVKTPQQKQQLARLETILPLVKRFQEAMYTAASTRVTETFKVGSQEIILVEASEERLVVRVKGTPKRYQWDEVPIGVAYGLVELELDQSPATAACKAAFAALHVRNGTAKEEARKLMQAAAAASVVPPDTHEVFDDEYSLD